MGEEEEEEGAIDSMSPLFVKAMIQLVESAEAYAIVQPMFVQARQDTVSAQLKKKVWLTRLLAPKSMQKVGYKMFNFLHRIWSFHQPLSPYHNMPIHVVTYLLSLDVF